MKKKILHLFRKYGYDIKKSNLSYIDYDKQLDRNYTSGTIIEFFGVSGVGKSTLFRKIFKEYQNDWYSREDIASIFKYHTVNPFEKVDKSNEFIYKYFYDTSLDRLLDKNLSIDNTFNFHRYFFSVIKKDAFAKFYGSKNGFFCDDGVIHNFSTSIIKLFSGENNRNTQHIKDFQSFLNNRIVIYFKASPEFVMKNLQKRFIETPDKLNFYEEHNYEFIMENIHKSMSIKSDILSLINKYQVPNLTLNVETESDDILSSKLKEFISAQMKNKFHDNE